MDPSFEKLLDSPKALDVLFDTRLIANKVGSPAGMEAYLDNWFEILFSDDVIREGLQSATLRHEVFPQSLMTLRELGKIHDFVGKIFEVHPVYAAAPWYDSVIALVRND